MVVKGEKEVMAVMEKGGEKKPVYVKKVLWVMGEESEEVWRVTPERTLWVRRDKKR